MNNNNISEMLASTMEKMQKMVDVNTIVGAPVDVGGGVTIIPISKVHIGDVVVIHVLFPTFLGLFQASALCKISLSFREARFPER